MIIPYLQNCGQTGDESCKPVATNARAELPRPDTTPIRRTSAPAKSSIDCFSTVVSGQILASQAVVTKWPSKANPFPTRTALPAPPRRTSSQCELASG